MFFMKKKPPTYMQAVTIREYGEPGVLKLETIETPKIADDEVLIEIRAAGVNPFDAKIRRGYLQWFYPVEFPFILGADYAGVVVDRGASVKSFKAGDKVWGLTTPQKNGSYAEYVALKAIGVAHMPRSLSFAAAASVPMGALTAWIALVNMIKIKPGDKVLVHAGAGGVGGFAIQIAKHLGAHVSTTCSARNIDYCKSLGADVAVDYTSEDFSAVIKDQDYAIDQLGGEVSLKTYESMKRGGVILLVERGHKIEMENRERLTAAHGVELREVAFENDVEALGRIGEAIEAGWLRPTLEETLTLPDAAAVHERIQTKKTRGKIVLQVKA